MSVIIATSEAYPQVDSCCRNGENLHDMPFFVVVIES